MQPPIRRKTLERWPHLAKKLTPSWSDTASFQVKINDYQTLLPLVEDALWQDYCASDLAHYQALCREMESLIEHDQDDRHDFVLIVPIADRPEHLKACLNSLLQLCKTYGYGGKKNGIYTKVQVIVADDSQSPEQIKQHRIIAAALSQQGLVVDYFGLTEQHLLLDSLSDTQQQQLIHIVGSIGQKTKGHKGASIMRNITYLKLNQLRQPKRLFYFFDSDQEFQVTVPDKNTFSTDYGLNYFFHLDQLFSQANIQILTGKVVGDPPVSPAVMANNFLDDVLLFYRQISQQTLTHPCDFHADLAQTPDDAAYHDMREMFGFNEQKEAQAYPCSLIGDHHNQDCLAYFSRQLNQFFYGEHPTRKTGYEYQANGKKLSPARTIYTGNYVFTADALDFFIPFAPLKLRMAGPVLGRLIQAQIGDQFVTANLPMLHKRTLANTGRSEYRSGVEQVDDLVDISDEFERQYFGDLMLFGLIELMAQGFLHQDMSVVEIRRVLEEKERELKRQYQAKQQQMMQKLAWLGDLLNSVSWEADIERHIQQFIDNVQANFSSDSQSHQKTQDHQAKQARIEQISHAIFQYKVDQVSWQSVIKQPE